MISKEQISQIKMTLSIIASGRKWVVSGKDFRYKNSEDIVLFHSKCKNSISMLHQENIDLGILYNSKTNSFSEEFNGFFETPNTFITSVINSNKLHVIIKQLDKDTFKIIRQEQIKLIDARKFVQKLHIDSVIYHDYTMIRLRYTKQILNIFGDIISETEDDNITIPIIINNRLVLDINFDCTNGDIIEINPDTLTEVQRRKINNNDYRYRIYATTLNKNNKKDKELLYILTDVENGQVYAYAGDKKLHKAYISNSISNDELIDILWESFDMTLEERLKTYNAVKCKDKAIAASSRVREVEEKQANMLLNVLLRAELTNLKLMVLDEESRQVEEIEINSVSDVLNADTKMWSNKDMLNAINSEIDNLDSRFSHLRGSKTYLKLLFGYEDYQCNNIFNGNHKDRYIMNGLDTKSSDFVQYKELFNMLKTPTPFMLKFGASVKAKLHSEYSVKLNPEVEKLDEIFICTEEFDNMLKRCNN